MNPKFSCSALLGALLFFPFPARAQTPGTPIPISAPNRILGAPGVRRETGNWLFNDSVFVSRGPNGAAPGAPVFISSLRRDKKSKLPLFRAAATGGPLNFDTLELPTLREMSAPGYNFAALQTRLVSQLNNASAANRVYVGWSLPTGNRYLKVALPPLSSASVAPIWKQLRAVLDTVAPDSALILDVNAVNASAAVAVSDIDAAASLCDAIVLHADISSADSLWPLKMARREVEEQKDFDLPVFVEPTGANAEDSSRDARLLEFWMGGATGFIAPVEQTPAWVRVVSRNPGLFAGAVTLEDAAVLPSANPQTLRIVADLRAAGRVPLVGRLPKDGDAGTRGESLFAILDGTTTLETLNGLDQAARAGSAIYLEGVPDLRNNALVDKLSEMTGINLEILAAPHGEILSLDDPWLFGDARAREMEVTQRVKWTIKTSLAGQTRVKKGEDVLSPYAAAKLATDANGLLMAPLGKGRVLWLAHALAASANPITRRAFYAAIAGNLQGALVGWKWVSVEDEIENGGRLHVALRAAPTGTPIVALWNDAPTVAKITFEARGDAPIALDLNSERQLPAQVVGYASNVPVSVPPKSFVWLTFALTRAALDKERLMPRSKARNR